MSQVVLITGSSRGLGKGFVQTYLSRPNVTVVAAVRSPESETATALASLPTGSGSRLVLVKIDAASPTDSAAAISKIQAEGIDHLDIVIANAGICEDFSRVTEVPLDVLQRHFNTNALGTLFLIQAAVPLLVKSKNPKFIGIGSALGSVGGMDQRAAFPCGAYGSSKAVQHWFVRKLHYDNETIVSFIADPGFVQTDMGYSGANRFGLDKPPTTIEDSVRGIVSIIDNATREKNGGRNLVWDGSEFPW